MTARLDRSLWPLVAFASIASVVYLVAAAVIVPALATAPRPGVLAAALVVDLVVLVPLAFAVLVARHSRWWMLTPVVLLSVGGAYLVLPEAYRGALDALVVIVPVVEGIALLAVVAGFVRFVRRAPAADPYDALRGAAARSVPGIVGQAIAYEVAVFRYALGRLAPPPADGYPARQSSGYGAVLAGVGIAAALELVGGHVLVRHLWGDGAALVHAGLSGYAILWLVGDWRALGARVTTLEDGVLRVRCGLRWSVDVPVADIEAIYHVRRDLPKDRPAVVAAPGPPRFAIDLARPVTASGPYGWRREVTRVALGTDDPDRFLDDLSAARGASENPRYH